MEQHDLEVLSRFEEVWRRVQQKEPEEKETADHVLEPLIDGLVYQWRGCRRLAACTCGTEKARLLALSDRIKKQIRTLQLQYFLKEGDVYFSEADPNFASYTPYNLRKLWQSTVKNAERIKTCNLNGNSDLVAELQGMDTEMQSQKSELEALISGLLR